MLNGYRPLVAFPCPTSHVPSHLRGQSMAQRTSTVRPGISLAETVVQHVDARADCLTTPRKRGEDDD